MAQNEVSEVVQAGPLPLHVLNCTEVEPRGPAEFNGGLSTTASSKKTELGVMLPLRLIDVNSTLNDQRGRVRFVTPKDWGFHVISHTWSQDIRDLSRRIGSALAAKGDTYNAACRRLDLRSETGFVSLREFLGLLSSDGVKRVWMDALCINQCDDNEKNREICSMAAFYRFSQGCYVSTHGLGQGFHLWPSFNEEQVVGSVPRWFKRAWTFQELLLPQTLHFIVDGLTHSTIANLNKGIANAGKRGFCICCIRKSPGFVMTTYAHSPRVVDCSACGVACHNMVFPSENNSIMENEERQHCSECRQPDLIRKAKIKNRADTYFVERVAYFFVVQASLGTQELLQLPYYERPALDSEYARKIIKFLNLACRSDCKAELSLLSQIFQGLLLHWFYQHKGDESSKKTLMSPMIFQSRISGRNSAAHSSAVYFGNILEEFAREDNEFKEKMLSLSERVLDLIQSDGHSGNPDSQQISESLFGIAMELINTRDKLPFYVFTETICYYCAIEGGLQKQKKIVESRMASEGIRRLQNLYSLLTKTVDSSSNPSQIELWKVALEIRNRDCSVEEDRILSILGLIPGMQVMKQVRTGGSLNSQLIDLTKKCSDKAVFQLCLLDQTNDIRGMSWAPKLTPRTKLDIDPDAELAELSFTRIGRIKEVAKGTSVENVTPHGIIITCGVIHGRLSTTNHGLILYNGYHELRIPIEYREIDVCSRIINFPKQYSCTIPVVTCSGIREKFKSDLMFLVVGKSDEKNLISIMCVPYYDIGDMVVLHKVGVVALLKDKVKKLIQLNTRCCIGGIGNYVDWKTFSEGKYDEERIEERLYFADYFGNEEGMKTNECTYGTRSLKRLACFGTLSLKRSKKASILWVGTGLKNTV